MIASLCLAHLEHEESTLREVRACLTELNEALRHGHLVQLDAARGRQANLAVRCEQLAHSRIAVCRTLAEELHLSSSSVTLTQVVACLPPNWGSRIHTAKIRIAALAEEVATLQQRNHSLIGYSREYLQRLLGDLTGSGTTVTRYSPRGVHLESPRGGLMQAQG